MDEAFVRHYMSGIERDRLIERGDRLELVRTLELLDQVLPPPPARVLDVGGGPGPYATRLARAGYEVRLRSITGFAARPGTAVEPMCSIATATSPTAPVARTRSRSKSAFLGQIGSMIQAGSPLVMKGSRVRLRAWAISGALRWVSREPIRHSSGNETRRQAVGI